MSFSDLESVFPTVNLVLAFIFPSCVSSGMLLNTSESLFHFVANSKLLAQWSGEGSKAHIWVQLESVLGSVSHICHEHSHKK